MIITTLALLTACGPRDLTPQVDTAALRYLADTASSSDATLGRIVSPDGMYAAWNGPAGESEARVTVAALSRPDTTYVITLGEADPGSGFAHRLRWTRDSRAVLITGLGRLGTRTPERLCLVYRVQEHDLITPPSCPDSSLIPR